MHLSSAPPERLRQNWRAIVARYQVPDLRQSLWMMINSIIPYVLLWALMAWSLQFSYWLTLALSIPAAGFLMRIFIIFHDCGHGSFFKSQRLNQWVGRITGVLTFTAFYHWTRDHAIHHATAGDLDRRGVGDVYTLTIAEYRALPLRRRLTYYLSRSPWVLFTVGAPLVFLVLHRFVMRPNQGRKEQRSVWTTNLALVGLYGPLCMALGWKTVLLVQLPIIWLGSIVGVWLFYVQHQYDGVYWRRHAEWDYLTSALRGASYYRLPRLLQWFSGNIGFHHLHHLSPRIPNYLLEKCQRENSLFEQVPTLTLWSSLRCVQANLYDEARQRMVSFRELRKLVLEPIDNEPTY